MSPDPLFRSYPMQPKPIRDEEMHECEGVQFNPKALEIISDIIGRLRRGGSAGGCLCPQQDWMNEICIHEPIQLLHDGVRAKQDMMEAGRVDTLVKPLALAVDVLRKIQECISRQVEDGMSQARTLRMRAGLASLPDEILSAVLEYAIIDEGSQIKIYDNNGFSILRTFRAIGELSFTCRRFRFIMTNFSNIWCRLWSGMDSSLVSALCKRLEKPVARIIIDRRECYSDMQGSDFKSFVNDVVVHSELWCRFTFDGSLGSEMVFLPEELQYLGRKTYRLHFPFLTHLTVTYPQGVFLDVPKEEDEHYYFSSWSTPSLKSLVISNLVPRPLTASSTLTLFVIKLHWPRANERTVNSFEELILFLASCSNLATFGMHLTSLKAPVDTLLGSQPIIFSSIKKLVFKFIACEAPLIKSFFEVAQFPNAWWMIMRISCVNGSSPAQDVLKAVLPTSPTHNGSLGHLRKLYLRLICAYSQQYAIFPYAALSKLKVLIISLAGVTFEHSLLEDPKPCLPVLRSLKFEHCRDLNPIWVRGLLGRLKSQGNVPQLAVVDCLWAKIDDEEYETDSDIDDDEDTSSSAGSDSSDEGSEDDESEREIVTVEDLLSMVS